MISIQRKTWYIVRRGNGYVETVDESSSKAEAYAMCREYAISDPVGAYSVTTVMRPTRHTG